MQLSASPGRLGEAAGQLLTPARDGERTTRPTQQGRWEPRREAEAAGVARDKADAARESRREQQRQEEREELEIAKAREALERRQAELAQRKEDRKQEAEREMRLEADRKRRFEEALREEEERLAGAKDSAQEQGDRLQAELEIELEVAARARRLQQQVSGRARELLASSCLQCVCEVVTTALRRLRANLTSRLNQLSNGQKVMPHHIFPHRAIADMANKAPGRLRGPRAPSLWFACRVSCRRRLRSCWRCRA